jgi:predicted nucleic acid-binding Zn finger protein
MTFRAANNHTSGVRTFYIEGDSGNRYVVQFIRRAGMRRWFCDCPDFKFRRLARKRHCKHLRCLAAMAKQSRGVTHLTREERQ